MEKRGFLFLLVLLGRDGLRQSEVQRRRRPRRQIGEQQVQRVQRFEAKIAQPKMKFNIKKFTSLKNIIKVTLKVRI